MDGVSQIAQSTKALGDLLKMATTEETEMAQKMVKVSHQMAQGNSKVTEAGKGMGIDTIA